MPDLMSEEEMFKRLSTNKPEAEIQQEDEQIQEAQDIPAAQTDHEKPVIETPPVIELEPVVESIKNLNASVTVMYGLIKTVVVPVLLLILVVGLAILLKSLI